MRINKSSDSGNQEEKNAVTDLRQLVTVCWSSEADSGFSGLSKFVLKQIKKSHRLFFFGV